MRTWHYQGIEIYLLALFAMKLLSAVAYRTNSFYGFFGPSHPAVRDRFESESEKQVKSLLFEGLFGNGNKGRPKKFDPNSVADRRFRDIHDRQIYFKVSYPFGEYTFRLGLGNGLEAWAKGTSDFNNIILEIEDNSIWNTL